MAAAIRPQSKTNRWQINGLQIYFGTQDLRQMIKEKTVYNVVFVRSLVFTNAKLCCCCFGRIWTTLFDGNVPLPLTLNLCRFVCTAAFGHAPLTPGPGKMATAMDDGIARHRIINIKIIEQETTTTTTTRRNR